MKAAMIFADQLDNLGACKDAVEWLKPCPRRQTLMSERDTQRAILDLLAAERVLSFRMNSGAMAGAHKGKKWFVRFGEKGMADILAFPYGNVLWIEVKSATGKQTEAQAEFQERVEAVGHYYLLGRDSERVAVALKCMKRLSEWKP